jgi:hypothetical protein
VCGRNKPETHDAAGEPWVLGGQYVHQASSRVKVRRQRETTETTETIETIETTAKTAKTLRLEEMPTLWIASVYV